MAALDIAMVIPAIPVIGAAFGLDARLVAWVYAAFTLSNLASVPVMGWLADTIDRRRVLLGAICLFVFGAIVVAASSSFLVLLVGRAFQGLATAGIFPVVSSIVGDTFPEGRRGRALGVLGSVFGLAFIVGPPVSGVLLQVDWRLIFVIAVPLGAAAAVMVARHVPSVARAPRQGVRTSFDAVGLLLLVAMVSLLAYALNGLDADALTTSLRRVSVLAPILVMLALFPVFLWVERNVSRPVVRLGLFRNRDVRIAVPLAIGAGFCEAAMVFTPYFAGEAFGVDRAAASFMFIPLALAVAVGAPLFGRLIDRAGVRLVVSGACAVLALGLGGYAFSADSRTLFFASSVFVGFGLAGLLGSSLNYIMLKAARDEERTTSQGFVTISLNVGLSLGAAVVGAIVASSATPTEGFRTAFLLLLGLAVVLLLLAARLTPASESASAAQVQPDA